VDGAWVLSFTACDFEVIITCWLASLFCGSDDEVQVVYPGCEMERRTGLAGIVK
jgi:hypothetical protein